MRRALTILIVLLLYVTPTFSKRCRCLPASGESTRPGANEHIVTTEQTYARVQGIVRAPNGEVLSDVLVEVFDHPEYLLLPYPEKFKKQESQRRVAACVVGNDGRFCFHNLPAGKYEVRFSKHGGWNHTSVVVSLVPRSRKALSKMEVWMRLGT